MAFNEEKDELQIQNDIMQDEINEKTSEFKQ